MTIELSPFETLRPAVLKRLEPEVERIGRFLDAPTRVAIAS